MSAFPDLAGLIRFKALSARTFDFSPTLKSLGMGVVGLLLRIPFTGVGLNMVSLEFDNYQ